MKKGLWIPAEILQIEELTAGEKITLAVIFSYSQGNKGACVAKNTTIAEVGGLSLSTVSHCIPSIINKGFLKETGGRQARELRPVLYPEQKAKIAEQQKAKIADSKGKNCLMKRQNLPNEKAKIADSFIYKETIEETVKKQGYISPDENLKNEGSFFDEKTGNVTDNERILSEFWKQELGV